MVWSLVAVTPARMCAFRVRDKAVPQLSHRGRTSVSGGRVALAGQPPLQGNGTCVWSLCAEQPLAADRRSLRPKQVGAPLSEMTGLSVYWYEVWLKSSRNRPQKNQKPYFNFAHLSLLFSPLTLSALYFQCGRQTCADISFCFRPKFSVKHHRWWEFNLQL